MWDLGKLFNNLLFSCVCVCVFRPRRGRTESVSPQLLPVLSLPLRSGSAQRAAVLAVHRSHGAGTGRYSCAGRQHKNPVLPRHLRTPHPASEWEHLRRVWWVWQRDERSTRYVTCDNTALSSFVKLSIVCLFFCFWNVRIIFFPPSSVATIF